MTSVLQLTSVSFWWGQGLPALFHTQNSKAAADKELQGLIRGGDTEAKQPSSQDSFKTERFEPEFKAQRFCLARD